MIAIGYILFFIGILILNTISHIRDITDLENFGTDNYLYRSHLASTFYLIGMVIAIAGMIMAYYFYRQIKKNNNVSMWPRFGNQQ